VPLPRLGRRLPEPLTPEEAEAIVTAPDASPRGLRDRAMLELMYGAGLRVSEVVSLRVSDIDLEEGLVRCMGKGARQRVVPSGRSRPGGEQSRRSASTCSAAGRTWAGCSAATSSS